MDAGMQGVAQDLTLRGSEAGRWRSGSPLSRSEEVGNPRSGINHVQNAISSPQGRRNAGGGAGLDAERRRSAPMSVRLAFEPERSSWQPAKRDQSRPKRHPRRRRGNGGVDGT